MQKGIRDDLYERPTKASAEYFIGKTLIIGGKSDMDAGSIKLAQGVGGQKVSFPGALSAEDDLALLASTRECTRNGSPEKKEASTSTARLGFQAQGDACGGKNGTGIV